MAELVITNKEYVYLKIPTIYIGIYHRLMELMVDYGQDMLKDCKATCFAKNVEVDKCFTMFNAALYARELGKTKLEETLIKYIKAKLKLLKGKDTNPNFTIKLEDGSTGYVDCTVDPPVIRVDSSEVIVKNSIRTIVVKPTDYSDLHNYQEYANRQIVNDNIINDETITNISESGLECSLNETKLLFIVLVPDEVDGIVKIDDGFGNKVEFGSTGLWYSNGEVKVTLDGVLYKVYGEIYTISCNVKYYIVK